MQEVLQCIVSKGLPPGQLFGFACDGGKNISCLPSTWLNQLDPTQNLYVEEALPDAVVESSNPVFQTRCANHVLNLVNLRVSEKLEVKERILEKAFEVIKYCKISNHGTFLKMLGFPKPRTHNTTRWWTSYLSATYYLVVAKALKEMQNRTDPKHHKVTLLTEDELKVLFEWVSCAKPCFDLNVELQQVCRDLHAAILT